MKRYGIRDPYGIHKTVYSLFPGTQRTFLYYDQGGDRYVRRVLILSQDSPDVPEYGTLESKRVSDGFLEFYRYAFQVRVNPVISRSVTGKREAITERKQMLAWFLEKAPSWGFKVDGETLELFQTGVQSFEKGSGKVIHNAAEFRGVLSVTDGSTFRKSFSSGIGKAKAFGFGLLQIRPLQ